MKKILTLLVTLGLVSSAFAADFTSFQLASTTLTNGYILQTNGKNNKWVATSSLGFSTGGSGTVTSVSLVPPTGLTAASSSCNLACILTLSLASGYVIPLSASTTQWNTFYNASNTLVTFNYASSTFPSFTYSSSTHPSFGYGSSTYYFASNPSGYITSSALTPYVTLSYGSSTYLPLASSSLFYLASNPSGYVTNSVSNLTNYPTYTYASATYALASQIANFLTYAYASSTYASTSWVTATFVPFSYGSSTYVAITGNQTIGGNKSFTGTTNLTNWTGSNGTSSVLDVTSVFHLNGATLVDSNNASGTLGQLLQSTGTSTRWVSTSTLGISGALSGGTTGWLPYWTSASTLSAFSTGTPGQLLSASSTSSSGFAWVSTSSLGITGGSATPGGSDTQIQFNDGGTFGGTSTFTYDKTTRTLTLGQEATTFFLTAKDAVSSNTSGGVLNIYGGDGNGNASGGTTRLYGGTGGVTGDGGSISILAGNGGATSGIGGSLDIRSGYSNLGDSGTVSIASEGATDGSSGNVTISSGNGGNLGGSGNITLSAGMNGSSATTRAGNVVINAGNSLSGIGGHIELRPGYGLASNHGYIIFRDPDTAIPAYITTSLLSSFHIYSFPDEGGTFTLGTGSAGNCAQWSTTNTLTDTGSPCGGGSSITLKTNGTLNGSSTLLNLIAGTNITLTDNGVGGVTIDASSGGLSGGQTGYLTRWLSPTTVGTSTILDDGVVAGVNATSSLYGFYVKGDTVGSHHPFAVASTSGQNIFSVESNDRVVISKGLADSTNATGTLGQVLKSTGTSTIWVATSSLGITATLSGGTAGRSAVWTSASALTAGTIRDNGTVAGVNATSSAITFNISGKAGTADILNVASSTGTSTSYLNINYLGKVVLTPSFGQVVIGTTSSPTYGLTVGTTSQFTGGIVQRVVGYASAASTTINVNNTDIATTTIFATTTFVNPVGKYYDGQMFQIAGYATTTRQIFLDTSFGTTTGFTSPITMASGTTYYLFQYSKFRNKWDYMSYQGPFY